MTTYDYFLLTKKECKIQAFVAFLIFFVVIGSFLLPFLNPNTVKNSDLSALFFVVYVYYSVLFSCVSCFIFIAYIQELDERYGIRSKIRLGNTYQYRILFLVSICPPIIICVLSGSYLLANLITGVGLCFSFIFPLLSMFLRIDVFNDNSSLINNELVLGYRPELYFLSSTLIGLYGYYFGFYSLSLGNFESIVWIFIVFLFQLVLVFPDRINNVLLFELRKAKYCAMFLVLWLVLFALFVLFFQPLLLGSGVFYLGI